MINDQSDKEARPSTLYVVGMPIGNMGDITSRAVRILSSVDIVAAEDTRNTKRLLSKLNLQRRLISYREHNEVTSSDGIIKLLFAGNSVALVTDAGTPGICDPGAIVVAKARDAGYRVEPIPGVSALTAALSVSGLTQEGFLFKGFLPAKSAERKQFLKSLISYDVPVVLFETPHRIKACLSDMVSVFGEDLRVFIGRELTKANEETVSLSLRDAVIWVSSGIYQSKGEFVITLFLPLGISGQDNVSPEVEDLLADLLKSLPLKQTVDIVAKYTQTPRKRIYQMALDIKNGSSK
ncbi:MAG: 16S rRNA (cytidine(1402)-2'-O)-methyltransferase [Proteobacteria bacterium]|nr:16S rRNA (cytidine(1402)-2'-O)-methyltransferase [Pseudomonadota bacterium]MDA1331106.1 16S rRNA (cytidine(1402)-2'-O)-methyltransferase [Pseudomonadota bacterium]